MLVRSLPTNDFRNYTFLYQKVYFNLACLGLPRKSRTDCHSMGL
jgi:hypothetical protein